MQLILREGMPEYDPNGRVRVDCGEYEDWVLPDDLPNELCALLSPPPEQSGATPPKAAPEAATTIPRAIQGPSVTARELAEALREGEPGKKRSQGTARGRELTDAELEARERQEAAKAAKLEAEAELAALRARREAASIERELDEERERARERRRRADECAAAATVQAQPTPPTPPAPPDPATAAAQERDLARAQYETLQYRVQQDALMDAALHRVAGTHENRPGWYGCGGFLVAWFMMGFLACLAGNAGWVFGALALPVAIIAAVAASRWARGEQQRTLAALEADRRREEYYNRTGGGDRE